MKGRPDGVPYAGLALELDRRLGPDPRGRVWGGFTLASTVARETDREMTGAQFPLQTATWLAATARVQLGEFEEDGVYFSWEARGELGTAFVTRGRTEELRSARSLPAVGSLGLTGRMGGRRTRGFLTIGWAMAVAGSGTGIDPAGLDVRCGLGHAW
jgi:hypothetical protein